MICFPRHGLSSSRVMCLALMSYVLAVTLIDCKARNRNGGEPVKPGELPFVATIITGKHRVYPHDDWRMVCQGAIIDYDQIITAAGCIDPSDRNSYKVLVGCFGKPCRQQLYGIGDIKVIEPQSDNSPKGAPRGDIALIKLEPSIQFNGTFGEREVAKIKVAMKGRKDETWGALRVAGWGPDPSAQALTSLEVKAVSSDECRRAAGAYYSDAMMCTKNIHLSQPNPCIGYAGGPLFKALEDGVPVLVGIVPSMCLNTGQTLNTFLRVSSYRIRETEDPGAAKS